MVAGGAPRIRHHGSHLRKLPPHGYRHERRPSDALNLIALVPAPIFAAQEVLADAETRPEGDSAEAILLRRALECEQMTVRQGPSERP